MKSSTLENSFAQPLLQYREPCFSTSHIKLPAATENNIQCAGMVVLRFPGQALRVPGRFEASFNSNSPVFWEQGLSGIVFAKS